MTQSLAFLHTVPGLLPVFADLARAELPGRDVFHIVDDRLLARTIRDGALSVATKRRMLGHIWSAVDAGAGAVIVTCSTLGTAVEEARPFCPVPLFRIDQGMAHAALAIGPRVGVIATLPTTLAPTAALIEGLGGAVIAHLCDGAFARLQAGDAIGHDAAIAEALLQMAPQVDVIVLAQASMARAAAGVSVTVPVLTSPELGLRHIRDRLS